MPAAPSLVPSVGGTGVGGTETEKGGKRNKTKNAFTDRRFVFVFFYTNHLSSHKRLAFSIHPIRSLTVSREKRKASCLEPYSVAM